MKLHNASERQVQAADPTASTWLSANAGSGKTKVLTDRVARLLLDGVEPQRILCLTYTKAAASEMQNRLFKRLGEWAMLGDAPLTEALCKMGVDLALGADKLAKARRLFARAIETPGGLRIQTIHSFCASLLRRFPLEAGVAPQFIEMDDRTGRLLRTEIVEEMADQLAPAEVARVAREYTGEDLVDLAERVTASRPAFHNPLSHAEAMRLFGLPANTTEDQILRDAFLDGESALLREVATILGTGLRTDALAAGKLEALSLDPPTIAGLVVLESLFLNGKAAAAPYMAKIGGFPTKAMRAALGTLLVPLEQLMVRVEQARPRRIALQAATRTLALHGFARVFLPEYAARKSARGWLDFDDLIEKAQALLTDPSVAQWVLFRLDGGIDHILVDEAQDTSPSQWQVIERLAQEFTTGHGARDVPRTIFVVGDKKQSIYSFQGADLAAFDAMKAHFRQRLSEVETHLGDLTLEHSFRSSPAILRLVDLTFDPAAGRDLGGGVKHIAFKGDMPGRVDLWPVIPPSETAEDGAWYDPVDLISDTHHTAQLARKIAALIRAAIADGVRIPTDSGPRSVKAGDFLILVQRRSALFSEIIRACKVEGLPIAGADRLKLGGELAVRDLTALLSFLITPEDDLSLAAALRSPLFGWSEGQLFSLAQGRNGYLWTALRDREAEHAETHAILKDLRDQSDFLRPFDVLERALTRHDGRRKLLARLGDEAEDGIDELLSQALAYERTQVPSLTGFLGWITADEIDVKRQMDAAGDRIRVMTIHGAKGLEAPVVILPETQDRKPRDSAEIVVLPPGLAVWRTKADESPQQVTQALADARAKSNAESLRLLYVAMTRAQCWLIAAAAGKVESENCWYNIIRAGMEAAGAEHLPDQTLRLSHGDWPDASAVAAAPTQPSRPTLPDWVWSPPPDIKRPEPLLSPSALGGEKVLAGEDDVETDGDAKARGTFLHLLLQHLPLHPPGDWERIASALLPGSQPIDLPSTLAEARSVIEAPHLARVFAPGGMTEVAVTGDLLGRRVLGSIDRLIVAPTRILAIDFKSNRLVPRRAEDVPEGLLRQMGAYAALLEQVYPDRAIEVAILWTARQELMPLPRELVIAAMQRATLP